MNNLNLGCGMMKKEGFINVDFRKGVSPDIVWDMNVFPYPFESESIDVIEAFHIIEHLDKPFVVMKELHRILKPGGRLHIKVPHFSRGLTHCEHKSGFDVIFPFYFDKSFIMAGYDGVDFACTKTELHWMAFLHLMPYIGIGRNTIRILRVINVIINFFAALSPRFCSRIWCFMVGGMEEIEFEFIRTK